VVTVGLALLFVPTALFRIRDEEAFMRHEFGEAWAFYSRRS
jgi:protein-S-isoprenylcysteine O-methyltransferase Ste14